MLFIIAFLFFTETAMAQTVEFSDDFEDGAANWTLTGNWGATEEQANGGDSSLTDSPGSNYEPNSIVMATLAENIDLSAVVDATLQFDAIFDIEGGFDFCYVEISGDGGASWIEVGNFSGEFNLTPWTPYNFSLGGLIGSDLVKIRFRLSSDPGGEGDGIYIDNIEIISFDQDNSPPLILHTPPEFYESDAGAVTMTAEFIDISGVESIALNYSIEGGANQNATGTNVSGNIWDFVIPAAEAGAQIDYSLTATDSSVNSNVSVTSIYSYIAGQHEFFDDGFISNVQSFGPDASSNLSGSAVRYTLDDRRIAFALIRNYTDANRPNEDMEVHVWGADSTGMLPGEDLISPLIISPEANLYQPSIMTRVDLRDFQALWNITGDIFIGFTVPSGETWTVQTNPGIGNSTYELGANGWIATPALDYHYRIVTTDPKITNIEEIIFDSSIELFPNPTSGNAQLKLDLERTSDLTIQISNQLGQAVDFFTEKNVGFGNVELNTAQLIPGIYYISISNGEVVSTKKLVKQ